MLTKLRMRILPEKKEDFHVTKASLMQGVLMEQIDSDYARELHVTGLHPYRQSLLRERDSWIWEVAALNEEAYRRIILPLKRKEFQDFFLKHSRVHILVEEKGEESISYRKLMESFYEEQSSGYYQITFATPTAFKRDGAYIFYPDIRCVYQSLMNKYSAASPSESLDSQELLEQLVESSRIIQYNVRSVLFHIEGIRIPSFVGEIRIKNTGAQTMKNFIELLFRFGEYSGVGIKCAIGMGALQSGRREKP